MLIFIILLMQGCMGKNKPGDEIRIIFSNNTSPASDSVMTISSLRAVNDIFTFRYYGDYSDILLRENQAIREKAKIACSLFSVNNENNMIFGRNLDLQFDLKNILVGFYQPPEGYSSITICALDFLIGNQEMYIDSLTDFTRSQILKTPFYAMDGINEMGLAVGIAAVESQKIAEGNKKEKIDILLLIRLILDNAASVDEAVKIADKYDVFDEDINTISHHYLIADSTGHSVIIEYQDGGMQFIYGENNSNYQIITNSLVKDRTPKERNGNNRYIKMNKPLSNNDILTTDDAMQLLRKVSWGYYDGPGSQWSVVYNLKARTGFLTVDRKYSDIYVFSFD